MRRQKRNLLTLGAIVFAVLLFAILGIVQTEKSHKTVAIAQDIPGPQEGLPTIGGAFQLVDKDEKTRKDTDFKGKPMLVYFGYTFCPDICPTALYHMTQAMEELGGAKTIQPIFITFDPHRDTPSHLKAYSQNFHKDFVMLTGSKEQVNQAIKAYRVHASRSSEESGADDYLMDHSSLIYLMDKEGKYRAHFNHKTPPTEIVKRVRLYLEKGE
ncbi:MAG TPA: SCO family protein [Alphaproteobacteria bacterium]|nr:SCO family protein [Alphaproteobacteria bacterium]